MNKNLKLQIIDTYQDLVLDGTTYFLAKINAKELSEYLKSSLKNDNINYQDFNSDKTLEKSYSSDKEELEKTIIDPPIEIYEYQNFFLLEDENNKYVLLDGFRRLLWYNAPDIEILVRIYRRENLTDSKILRLLVYLNHFKFFGGGNYHDRGFALLLKTVFGLNIHEYRIALDGYLTGNRVKNDYGSDWGNTGNKKNNSIKERILNPLFISDINFLEQMSNNKFMVNSFMGARLYQERLKSNEEFDFNLFLQFHKENKVLNSLIEKFEKAGTNNSAKSQAAVNQIMEIYDNIFVLMKGGKTEKSYAELMKDCKGLVAELKKDKNLTKLTGNSDCHKIEKVIKSMLEEKMELKFTCVVYPKEYKSEMHLDCGLLKKEIKFLRMVKGRGYHDSAEMVFGFKDDNNNEFIIRHNYGEWHSYGKKYTKLNSNTMMSSQYDIDLFVNISKNFIKE